MRNNSFVGARNRVPELPVLNLSGEFESGVNAPADHDTDDASADESCSGRRGKNGLVRWIYDSYSGERFFIAFSSDATPETFSSKNVISAGLIIVHQVFVGSVNPRQISQCPHQSTNSPK